MSGVYGAGFIGGNNAGTPIRYTSHKETKSRLAPAERHSFACRRDLLNLFCAFLALKRLVWVQNCRGFASARWRVSGAHRLAAIAIAISVLATMLPWWNRIWFAAVTSVVVACDHVDAVFTVVTSSARKGGSGNKSSANWYVSPTGSDSNPCSQSSPCATPDHAFNLASPGQTVQVATGTYDYASSTAQFTKSGTAGNYITVTCATRGACKIQNSVTGNGPVAVLAGSYITFDGFEVTNTSSAGNNLGLYVTSSFVNITHNTIHHIETDCGSNGGGGITVAGSGSSDSGIHNITIDANKIYDINYRNGSASCPAGTVKSDGILVETAGTANQVTNNIVYHTSGGWGIALGNSNATHNHVNTVISNNTVFSTALGGILITSGDGTTISNNIVVNTGQLSGRCGITAPPGIAVTYLNNELWNNGGGNYCLEWGSSDQSVHSTDKAVDPALGTTFVNWQADGSGDYHLKAGSPMIDNGSSVGAPPTHDFDGNPRPQGDRYDIGAYEHN
jgi:pectate disaccharide-lyase